MRHLHSSFYLLENFPWPLAFVAAVRPFEISQTVVFSVMHRKEKCPKIALDKPLHSWYTKDRESRKAHKIAIPWRIEKMKPKPAVEVFAARLERAAATAKSPTEKAILLAHAAGYRAAWTRKRTL